MSEGLRHCCGHKKGEKDKPIQRGSEEGCEGERENEIYRNGLQIKQYYCPLFSSVYNV